MKLRLKVHKLPLIILFMFACGISAADYAPKKKKYSIISHNDEIFTQFDKYSEFQNAGGSSEAAVLEEYLSSDTLKPSAQSIAGQEILNYLDGSLLKRKGYSPEKWQKKDSVVQDNVSAGKKDEPPPLPPGIMAKLPFESRLSLSGRKLIAFDLTSRSYDKEEDGQRKNTSNFKMDQELQMRIMGSVGDRLNIDVDYDDVADKRDISLIYKGQPGEVIREAAFGDISVSLPTTEFVGYSKELFGLKVDAGHKKFGVSAFFSKTKGSSEMKRYTGNTQLERRTISDTSYIRLKYYSILKPAAGKTIMAGSAMVYMDYQRIDPRFNIAISTDILLNDIGGSPNTYRGNFVLLVAGQDYTIDYNTGVLSFKNTLANNYSVAVDYQFTDGTWLHDYSASGNTPLIIKDANNTQGVTTEVMTYYNLGNLKINRDNGRGNFILEIQDLNGGTPADIDGAPVPKYPSGIIVDFENGVFNLANPLHGGLYSLSDHKYNFITEYQYNAKVLSLRPGIVPQSEKVVVDGRALANNTDYIIDYDMGILTILKDDIVHETSVIDVSYDYSMFGTESESTLIGANSRLELTDNISVGASVLYNSASKGNALPDIRSTPESLLVAEVDAKITDLDIDALNMRINADAEYAVSSQDDNTAGKALVDSMDNSLQEDTASLVDEFWFHSSNAGKSVPSPDNVTGSVQTGRYLNDLSWKSREINIRDIDPALETVDGQKQLVLDVNYNLYNASEIAFSNVLSLAGYDFSKKLYVDVWIKDNSGGADFAVDYLSAINEDADSSNALDTEDKMANGFISPWEDTGQEFHNMGNMSGLPSLIGAHNGKLDTEDLNGNGILDTYEEFAGSFLLSSGTVIKDLNGWKQIRIPADAASPSVIGGRRNVRYIRFRVVRGAGGQQNGSFSIGKIAIVGNRWEQASAGDPDFSVSSIGKYDPDYKTIMGNNDYRSLYDITGSPRKDDQALKITYNVTGARHAALARSVYTGDYLDLSKYESLRFFVYAKYANPGDVIVFRAGGNDENYFEYSVPVTADASWDDWKLITIDQKGYGRGAKWSSSDPSAVITSSGMPSLDRVSQFTLGVTPDASSMSEARVWFKEIHVSGSKTLDGSAWKAGGNLRWKGNGAIGAVTAGVYRKSIGRDFQTITAGVYNRDYLEDSAYVDFEGLKTQTLTILPVKAGISKYKTVTPDIMDNNSNLISINEQGTVTTYTGYAETNLNLGVDLPQIGAQYSRSIIDSSEIKRLEDRETVSGNLVYNNPVLFPLLPTNVTANARTVNSYYRVYPDKPIADSGGFLGLDSIQDYISSGDYHTLEQTKMFSVQMPFKFSKGIVFSPAYVIDNVNEKNKDFPTEISYDKSRNQTVGASLVLGIASWFSPTFTYNINTRENYDIYSSTDAENPDDRPGQNKYIERSGIGEISWNLNAYDITKSKFLKSLNFSAYYRLQDSDSYDNVDKNFDSMGFSSDRLWIRDNLLMEMQPSYSTNSYVVKTVMNRNDVRIIGRYMPFEAFGFKGKMSPLGSMSANFTYTEGSEGSYITGTSKDVYTKIFPELLLGMSGIEKFFGGEKWISDSQMNFKYFDKNITTYGISYIYDYMRGFDYRFKVLRKLDLYFSLESTDSSEADYASMDAIASGFVKRWVGQGGYDYGRWRFSLRYESEELWQKNGAGKYSSQVLKNSYLGQINADLMFPSGIKIPIINTVIPLKNRLILLSNIKYITQESAINVETDNNVNYGFSADMDYEVSKYLRFLLGCSWSRFEYTYNADLNYSDISLISKLTIQF